MKLNCFNSRTYWLNQFCSAFSILIILTVPIRAAEPTKSSNNIPTLQVETGMQRAFGSRVLVHRIKSINLKGGLASTHSNNAKLPIASVSDGKDLILGMDDDGVHLYLVSGGIRVDYSPGLKAGIRQTDVIEKGSFLRIRSSAGEDLSQVLERAILISGRNQCLICNTGVVSFLTKGMGLQLPVKMHESFLAHHVFRSLIRNEIKDSMGRPMSLEVFVVGDRPAWVFQIYGTLVVTTAISLPSCIAILQGLVRWYGLL